MSKNLTRKGLALGALVALTSTVIAGTPALAAGELVVAPSAGTSYATFVTETFNLKTSFAPGSTPSSYAQLKYQVKTDGVASIKANVNTGAAVTAAGAAAATAFSGNTANTYVISASRASAGAANGAAYSADDAGAAVTSTTQNFIGLQVVGATATTTSTSVEVTAFVDANNDGALSAGEWNAVQTVSFKKYSEVVPTVAITAPATADASVKATVALAGINEEQLGVTTSAKGNVDVTFTNSGTGTLAVSTTKADGVFTNTFSAGTLAADATVTARATYRTVELGTAAVSATVAARSIIQPTASVVAGDNGIVADNIARTNSAFSVAATVKDTTAAAAVKAGVAVTAAITTTATLSTTKTLSINGTVYNGTTAIPATVALTTDAAGLAKVNFVTTGFVATEAISVVFAAQNFTVTVPVDLQDAVYTVKSTATGSALRSIVEGGSTTINYAVKDQFGVVIGSGARLEFVVGYSTPVTSYVAVTNGAASITVTDTTTSTDADITVAATLQTQDVATSNWGLLTPSVTATAQTVYVTATALSFDTVPVAQSIALSTSVALTTSSVTNPGAAVTVAAKGFTFTVNSVDYTDTVTLFAGASGDVVVYAKSNTSGAQTVTFTAGTDVKTAVVTVASPAETAGASIDLSTVPATIVPGSTLVITGYVKDTYGNGVDTNQGANDVRSGASTFSVVYTGPGFIVGGSEPVKTDANGKFTFTVILGVNDSGSASVAVKYDADGATTTVAEISKTATIAIAKAAAPAAAAAASGSTAKFYVSVVNAAGKTVVVKVGGKFVRSFIGATAKKVVALASTKGSKAVTVFVGGKLVLTKTVSVK